MSLVGFGDGAALGLRRARRTFRVRPGLVGGRRADEVPGQPDVVGLEGGARAEQELGMSLAPVMMLPPTKLGL